MSETFEVAIRWRQKLGNFPVQAEEGRKGRKGKYEKVAKKVNNRGKHLKKYKECDLETQFATQTKQDT
jgi:hypothetical protein